MGQSPLSEISNGLIIGSKLAFFVDLTCRYTKRTGHEFVKMGICDLAIFSKTVGKKAKRHLQGSSYGSR